jgi:hypothetical protein
MGKVVEREGTINPDGIHSIECSSPYGSQYSTYANNHYNINSIGNSIDSTGKNCGASKVHGGDDSARNRDQ